MRKHYLRFLEKKQMKQIAKIEFVHLNNVDYVIGMLTQIREKAAKIYEPEDIQLLIKQTDKNTATVMFYILEKVNE